MRELKNTLDRIQKKRIKRSANDMKILVNSFRLCNLIFQLNVHTDTQTHTDTHTQ